jgi:hypothetical protein
MSLLLGIAEDRKLSNTYVKTTLGPRCKWTSTTIPGIVIPANEQNEADMLYLEYYIPFPFWIDHGTYQWTL